jgi:hypothetical protein
MSQFPAPRTVGSTYSLTPPAVLVEAFRVLATHGRLGISDVIAQDHRGRLWAVSANETTLRNETQR